MTEKQSLVIIICRSQIDPNLIPPLKTIIPMLYNLMPLRIFTSDNHEIKPEIIQGNKKRSKSLLLYEKLVQHLETTENQCDLTLTLKTILDEYMAKPINKQTIHNTIDFKKGTFIKDKNKYAGLDFRVCLLGSENVSWNIVMQYKKNNIVIDTASVGSNQKADRLIQISYITGGIHKIVNQKKMIKRFLCDFQMDTNTRKLCLNDQKQTVQFTLQCFQCNNKTIKQDFMSCTVCLAVYCTDKIHDKMKNCQKCNHHFD